LECGDVSRSPKARSCPRTPKSGETGCVEIIADRMAGFAGYFSHPILISPPFGADPGRIPVPNTRSCLKTTGLG
jgi:hypothetical protein